MRRFPSSRKLEAARSQEKNRILLRYHKEQPYQRVVIPWTLIQRCPEQSMYLHKCRAQNMVGKRPTKAMQMQWKIMIRNQVSKTHIWTRMSTMTKPVTSLKMIRAQLSIRRPRNSHFHATSSSTCKEKCLEMRMMAPYRRMPEILMTHQWCTIEEENIVETSLQARRLKGWWVLLISRAKMNQN